MRRNLGAGQVFGPSMKLTKYTDYAIRVLMYLASDPERLASVAEIARGYGISQNHLTKVVHNLGRLGYIVTARGRSGGIRLARPATEINIGAVIRQFEDDFDLVDCQNCVVQPVCGLSGLLNRAVRAFLAVADGYSLADISTSRSKVIPLMEAWIETHGEQHQPRPRRSRTADRAPEQAAKALRTAKE